MVEQKDPIVAYFERKNPPKPVPANVFRPRQQVKLVGGDYGIVAGFDPEKDQYHIQTRHGIVVVCLSGIEVSNA